MNSMRPSYTVRVALKRGLRSVRHYPMLAVVFLAATLSQGALQGLLVWVLRDILRAFSQHGSSLVALVRGAGLVFGVWMLRSMGGSFAQRLIERIWRAFGSKRFDNQVAHVTAGVEAAGDAGDVILLF